MITLRDGKTHFTGMSRRTLIRGLCCAATVAAIVPPAWAAVAIKHYILIDLKPGADQLMMDRWYLTYHAPQVRRAFKAWQRNYVSFRSYLPPAEAVRRYPILYGRMTEIQFDTLQDYRDTRPKNIYGAIDSFTPPPGGFGDGNELYKATSITVPVNADELVVSLPTPPKELPYLRWIILFHYPDHVSDEDGDAWWINQHAPELSRLPGLKRLAFYRGLREEHQFKRVAEFWFDDYPAWRDAFLNPGPELTAPEWSDQFPFANAVSMFVGENPDINFIHDDRVIP